MTSFSHDVRGDGKSMSRIVFLEGLPKVGKTTIANTIKMMPIPNVFVVDEIVVNLSEKTPTNQEPFIRNDEIKLAMFDEGLIIIDRGPISTLSYNMTRSIIDKEFDSSKVVNWFNRIKNSLYSDDISAIYLENFGESYYLPFENDMDPYGSVHNQKILEQVTISNCKRYLKKFKIREYHKNDMEAVIDEIIS